jgi:hypothetical protein
MFVKDCFSWDHRAEGTHILSSAADWVQTGATVVIAGIAVYSGIKGTRFIEVRRANEKELPVETPGDAGPVVHPAGNSSPSASMPRPARTLTLADLGKTRGPDGRGGALIVRLQYGGSFSDPARPKYGPAHDTDAVIKDNTVRYWAIGVLVDYWQAHMDEIPDKLIGVTGPVENRIIISSLKIDREWIGLASPAEPGVVKVAEADKDTQALDYLWLRYQQVTGVRFGNISPAFFIWVDNHGRVRAGGRGLLRPAVGRPPGHG